MYFLFVFFLETSRYSPVQKEANRKLLTLIIRIGFLRVAFSGGEVNLTPYSYLKKGNLISINFMQLLNNLFKVC